MIAEQVWTEFEDDSGRYDRYSIAEIALYCQQLGGIPNVVTTYVFSDRSSVVLGVHGWHIGPSVA